MEELLQFSGSNSSLVLKNLEHERTDMVIGKEHQLLSIQIILSYLGMFYCFPAFTDVNIIVDFEIMFFH